MHRAPPPSPSAPPPASASAPPASPSAPPTSPDPTTAPLSLCVDDLTPIEVGPGCLRRDLPSAAGARAWVVDMAPGSRWPRVDVHGEGGEQIYVVSGELIEGDRRFGPGAYLLFGPGSRHRPRTEIGVRLFGVNLGAGPAPRAGGLRNDEAGS